MNTFWTSVVQQKDKIYVRGFKNGKRFSETVSYSPYLFVPNKEGTYKTIHGDIVEKLKFDTISDARDFMNRYQNIPNYKIYGSTNFLYTFLYDTYSGVIDYNHNLIHTATIDIETKFESGFPNIEEADQEITAITIRTKGKSYVFGCKEFTPHMEDIVYFKCRDEKDLIQKFISTWERLDIDIVTGWNIEFFDMPYIINRIKRLFGNKEANRLSPIKWITEKSVIVKGGKKVQSYNIVGIAILDYYQLYRKFTQNTQESYKLDYICQEEINERKIPFDRDLNDLYRDDPQKYFEYNVQDVLLVERLENKLKFLELVTALAYDSKINYTDTLTTVKQWETIIHNYLMDRRTVLPQSKNSRSDHIELMGGYVKDPKIGLTNWVVSFDLTSLYPHLQMQYNISPDTFVRRIDNFPSIEDIFNQRIDLSEYHENKYSVTANGCLFRKDKQGFIPALAQIGFEKRNEYKSLMKEAKKAYQKSNSAEDKRKMDQFDGYQKAKKVQINGLYGAVANVWFLFFNFDEAEAVTASGQMTIQFISKKVNEFLNKTLKTADVDYIIASDTDSIYLNLEPLVNLYDSKDINKITDMVDKFCEKQIQPYLEKIFDELYQYTNAYAHKMSMKRETIANKGLWRGKKMYVMNALDEEGVRFKQPELKFKGIEVVRSSTPQVCREAIKKALYIMMNEDQQAFQNYIAEFKQKFYSLSFEEVSSPRGVQNLNKYKDSRDIYKLATPIGVKAALIFNNLLQKHNIRSIQPIADGDKIRFSYLKLPNPIQDTVIGSPDILPKAFGLDKYIDYDKQFDKAFLDPVTSLSDLLGWHPEPIATLESFFE